MKKMILIQGCSGSGKTTLAEKLKLEIETSGNTCSVLTTDDFFMVNNEYQFDGTLLSVAHQWNQGRVVRALMNKVNCVIVPNTNTSLWEVSPYYRFSKQFFYDFNIIEPETSWKHDVEELTKRNVHGVPKEVIENQLKRMEDCREMMRKLNEGKD